MLTEATEERIQQLPEVFREVVEDLGELFGEGLRVDTPLPGWLVVRVVGLTDQYVFITIDRERERIFGEDLADYQVLCASDPARQPGVWIGDRTDVRVRDERHPGFWYY